MKETSRQLRHYVPEEEVEFLLPDRPGSWLPGEIKDLVSKTGKIELIVRISRELIKSEHLYTITQPECVRKRHEE